MNDPAVLAAVSAILTVLCCGLFLGWRRAHRGKPSAIALRDGFRRRQRDLAARWSVGDAELPAPAQILSGRMRRPAEEVGEMLAVWLTLGMALSVLSLFLDLDVIQGDQPLAAVPFLAAGLVMMGAGIYAPAFPDRSGLVERITGLLAYGSGMDLVQMSCLIGAAVFLALSAVSFDTVVGRTGRLVFGVALVAVFFLIASALWRFVCRPPASEETGKRNPGR